MKTQLLLALSLCLFATATFGDTEEVVQPIIDAFKAGDRDYIVDHVRYPLNRTTPIPSISDRNDFLGRFDDVFDAEFITRLSKSDPQDDWSQMGWRGIMFANGELWLDDDGYIYAINHQSPAEENISAQLILEARQRLHPSIADIKKPIFEWETRRYRIRLDELNDSSIRYAVWDVANPTSELPDLVLNNGTFTADGSGGNHFYSFENGKYRYVCYVIRLGTESSPPGYLRVFRGDDLLLEQPVERVVQ
ncbi:hypothetical protein [Saccharospirillum mangrovi]|uniref:hypothetical protein n=1 Tax=Saccharospirillum mangrovi TaxID=2161747 RepID=UPI000D37844A|nr:hypothetical protein [Saccharospirillum mangrovi]